jgi:hypothetical protein
VNQAAKPARENPQTRNTKNTKGTKTTKVSMNRRSRLRMRTTRTHYESIFTRDTENTKSLAANSFAGGYVTSTQKLH